jgi:PAS domain S-box-containing protein
MGDGVRIGGRRDARRLAVQIVAFAGVYAIAGRFSLAIASLHDASLVWASSGIALAVLLRGGLHLWPGVALGEFFVMVSVGVPGPAALAIGLGNALETVAGAYLIRRVAGQAWSLERVRDALVFIILCALTTTIGASVAVANLFAASIVPPQDAFDTWRVWWLANVVGDLVIAPLVLTWSAARLWVTDVRQRATAGALGAVLLTATLFVFLHSPTAPSVGFLQACMLIPLLIWASVRFGVRGATAAITLASVIAVAGTAYGLGPFAQESLLDGLLHQQAFMAIVAAAVLTVGAVTAERAAALAALRDATEAERRSSALLRLVADNIPNPVFAKDEQGRLLFANPATLESIGKPAEQTLGRTDREFYDDPEIGGAIVESDRRIMEAGKAVAVEERVETPRGLRWFLSAKAPFRGADGKVAGLVGVAHDITDRKRVEETLRESDDLLRLAHQMARVGSFQWDIQTGVNTWSPEMEVLYGLPPGSFPKTVSAWQGLIHPDDRAEIVRRGEEALATGGLTDSEWRAVWPDGSVHWIHGRWQVVKDASGKAVRMTGVNIDITERKLAEELRASEAALREADRHKNQFLAMLSHELRNPLAPIRNALYILERAAPGSEQAKRAQAVIDRQIGHMTWLTDDLLDVTRITRGKIRLQRERLDLDALVQHAAEDHRSLFAKAGVRLEVFPARTEIWVDGDRTRIAQAVGNLLQNAAKFTPHGGTTTVSVRADPARGRAILTVRDTGEGIEPEMVPRLFHPFVQADATLDRSKGGLGLGLALVKGLVELHGGSVNAASEGRGTGSTFTINLPLDVAFLRVMPSQRGVGGDGPPRRVLVIEDNEDAADTLREVLEFDERVVEVAYTGREGLDKAQAFHPDVVLCDIGLPEMDGYEVARRMRADPALGDVGLIAVSGYAQPEDVAAAKAAGFELHLAKPPSLEALERALAEVGRSPDTRREPLSLA